MPTSRQHHQTPPTATRAPQAPNRPAPVPTPANELRPWQRYDADIRAKAKGYTSYSDELAQRPKTQADLQDAEAKVKAQTQARNAALTKWLKPIRELKTPKGMDPAIYAQMMGFARPEPVKLMPRAEVVQEEEPEAPVAAQTAPQQPSLLDTLYSWLSIGGPTRSGSTNNASPPMGM